MSRGPASACVFTHLIDYYPVTRVLSHLFEALELLNRVDSLFALGTLLAHLDLALLTLTHPSSLFFKI